MTATKEKPILFSGEMVRAILSGRKTQERRIVKPQFYWAASIVHNTCMELWEAWSTPDENGRFVSADIKCPYEVGMRLWVRETWRHSVDAKGKCCIAYKADGSARYALADLGGEGDLCELGGPADPWLEPGMPWRPSIHMPRWASRITLEITDIRVQRLQDTTRLDIAAEGWPCDERQRSDVDLALALGDDEIIDDASIEWYANLWDSINTKPGTRWDDSPLVWCLSFRRVEE